MPNENPILTSDDGEYVEYLIPAAHKDKTLYLTTKTVVATDGWKLFELRHSLSVDGHSQATDPKPDLSKQALGICKDLDGKRMSLRSVATAVRDGSDDESVEIDYKIIFQADSSKLDTFPAGESSTGIVRFYTKIIFKIAS